VKLMENQFLIGFGAVSFTLFNSLDFSLPDVCDWNW
jgi:hypothetical protein